MSNTTKKVANANIVNATMEELAILAQIRSKKEIVIPSIQKTFENVSKIWGLNSEHLTDVDSKMAESLKTFKETEMRSAEEQIELLSKNLSFDVNNFTDEDFKLVKEFTSILTKSQRISQYLMKTFKFYAGQEKIPFFINKFYSDENFVKLIDKKAIVYYYFNRDGFIEIHSFEKDLTIKSSPEELFKYFKALFLATHEYEIDDETEALALDCARYLLTFLRFCPFHNVASKSPNPFLALIEDDSGTMGDLSSFKNNMDDTIAALDVLAKEMKGFIKNFPNG